MKFFLIFLQMVLAVSFGQYAADIRLVRYYASEMDFIADNRLMATGRTGTAHLQVFFNDEKLPVLKEWVDKKGDTKKREILEYDTSGNLYRRYELNMALSPINVTVYGEKEPWSIEFRKAISQKNSSLDYKGQISLFAVNLEAKIESVVFQTISGYLYGKINFYYNHLGFLVGEDWQILPEEKSIRRYIYTYDLISEKRELTEYGRNGEEVSRVVLALAPEDKLYAYPPPRTGNRLDEISILLNDIKGKDFHIPFDVFIPRTKYDVIILNSGERMEIKLIQMGHKYVRFKFPGTEEELHIPLSKVNSISNKFGENLYP